MVGYSTVGVSNDYTMVALNWESVDGKGIEINKIFAPEGLVAGQTVGLSDQIQVWNGSSFDIYPNFVSWAPGRRGFCRVTTTSRPASVQKPVFA